MVPNEPTKRHPDCPDVHIGVCATCRRLYARDLAGRSSTEERRISTPEGASSNLVAPAKEKVDAPDDIGMPEFREPDMVVDEDADRDAEREGSPGKPGRLEVVRGVLSSAERYARWRANQIEKDPVGFRKREKDRIARIRAGPKSPV